MDKIERSLAVVVALVMLAVGAGAAFVAAGELGAGGNDPGSPDDRGCLSPIALPGLRWEPDDLDEQIDLVRERVEVLRGLSFKDGVDVSLVSADQMRDVLLDELTGEILDRIEGEELLLRSLRLISSDLDLRSFYEDTFVSQVVGLYQPETDRLLVITEDDDDLLSPLEEVVLAHEFEHALVDDNFELPPFGERPPAEGDRALAEQALVEGSASALEAMYTLNALSPDQKTRIAEGATAAIGDYFDAPFALRQYGEFPYLGGFDLVCGLHLEDGWGPVNELFRDPPASTRQVMTGQELMHVILPEQGDEPGPGWDLAYSGSYGALDLEILLRAPGGTESSTVESPRDAIFEWGGGRVDLWQKEDRLATSISIRRVHQREQLLCGALGAWYLQTFPDSTIDPNPSVHVDMAADNGETAAILQCENDRVGIAIAPTIAAATRMLP